MGPEHGEGILLLRASSLACKLALTWQPSASSPTLAGVEYELGLLSNFAYLQPQREIGCEVWARGDGVLSQRQVGAKLRSFLPVYECHIFLLLHTPFQFPTGCYCERDQAHGLYSYEGGRFGASYKGRFFHILRQYSRFRELGTVPSPQKCRRLGF